MNDQVAVLVVEDEPLILTDIAFQLAAEGFKVYEAAHADAAIKLLVAHSDIRLIFTDIDVPGSRAASKLAAAVRKRWPPVKIIVTRVNGLLRSRILDGSVFFGNLTTMPQWSDLCARCLRPEGKRRQP